MRLILVTTLGLLTTLPLPAAAAATVPTTSTAAAAPVSFRDCSDCPDMITVPAGSIDIGSTAEERQRSGIPPVFGDREGPRLHISIAKAFALGRYEVTRGQYATFMAATGRPDPASCAIAEIGAASWAQSTGKSWRDAGYPQTDQHPAVCISYDDALAYTAWLSRKTGKSYRLASEAEWEYAARAGTSTAWSWGDNQELGCGKANLVSSGTIAWLGSPSYWQNKLVCLNNHANSTPVGSFEANAYGLHDMIGNAFEWIADCASTSHQGGPTDGSAYDQPGCTQRFLKGGAFHTPIWLTRSAVRGNPLPQDVHMNTIGFRVARAL
jgi:formylglycine-generating enzyme required for sulfatase activity